MFGRIAGLADAVDAFVEPTHSDDALGIRRTGPASEEGRITDRLDRVFRACEAVGWIADSAAPVDTLVENPGATQALRAVATRAALEGVGVANRAVAARVRTILLTAGVIDGIARATATEDAFVEIAGAGATFRIIRALAAGEGGAVAERRFARLFAAGVIIGRTQLAFTLHALVERAGTDSTLGIGGARPTRKETGIAERIRQRLDARFVVVGGTQFTTSGDALVATPRSIVALRIDGTLSAIEGGWIADRRVAQLVTAGVAIGVARGAPTADALLGRPRSAATFEVGVAGATRKRRRVADRRRGILGATGMVSRIADSARGLNALTGIEGIAFTLAVEIAAAALEPILIADRGRAGRHTAGVIFAGVGIAGATVPLDTLVAVGAIEGALRIGPTLAASEALRIADRCILGRMTLGVGSRIGIAIAAATTHAFVERAVPGDALTVVGARAAREAIRVANRPSHEDGLVIATAPVAWICRFRGIAFAANIADAIGPIRVAVAVIPALDALPGATPRLTSARCRGLARLGRVTARANAVPVIADTVDITSVGPFEIAARPRPLAGETARIRIDAEAKAVVAADAAAPAGTTALGALRAGAASLTDESLCVLDAHELAFTRNAAAPTDAATIAALARCVGIACALRAAVDVALRALFDARIDAETITAELVRSAVVIGLALTRAVDAPLAVVADRAVATSASNTTRTVGHASIARPTARIATGAAVIDVAECHTITGAAVFCPRAGHSAGATVVGVTGENESLIDLAIAVVVDEIAGLGSRGKNLADTCLELPVDAGLAALAATTYSGRTRLAVVADSFDVLVDLTVTVFVESVADFILRALESRTVGELAADASLRAVAAQSHPARPRIERLWIAFDHDPFVGERIAVVVEAVTDLVGRLDEPLAPYQAPIFAEQSTLAAFARQRHIPTGGDALVDHAILARGRVVDRTVAVVVEAVTTLIGRVGRTIAPAQRAALAEVVAAPAHAVGRVGTAFVDALVGHTLDAGRRHVDRAITVVVETVADLDLGLNRHTQNRSVERAVVALDARTNVGTEGANALVDAAELRGRFAVRRQAQRIAFIHDAIAIIVDDVTQLLGVGVDARVVDGAVVGRQEPVTIDVAIAAEVLTVAVLIDAVATPFRRANETGRITVVAIIFAHEAIAIVIAGRAFEIAAVTVLIDAVAAPFGRAGIDIGTVVVAILGLDEAIAIEIVGRIDTDIVPVAIVVTAVARNLACAWVHPRMPVVTIDAVRIGIVGEPAVAVDIGAVTIEAVAVFVDTVAGDFERGRVTRGISVVAIIACRHAVAVAVAARANRIASDTVFVDAVAADKIVVGCLAGDERMSRRRIAPLQIWAQRRVDSIGIVGAVTDGIVVADGDALTTARGGIIAILEAVAVEVALRVVGLEPNRVAALVTHTRVSIAHRDESVVTAFVDDRDGVYEEIAAALWNERLGNSIRLVDELPTLERDGLAVDDACRYAAIAGDLALDDDAHLRRRVDLAPILLVDLEDNLKRI